MARRMERTWQGRMNSKKGDASKERRAENGCPDVPGWRILGNKEETTVSKRIFKNVLWAIE
jgi:hypothetical protein